MSRIIAIDYGRKRTGIAVTDPMQILQMVDNCAHSSVDGFSFEVRDSGICGADHRRASEADEQ